MWRIQRSLTCSCAARRVKSRCRARLARFSTTPCSARRWDFRVLAPARRWRSALTLSRSANWVHPYAIAMAREILAGSSVGVCPVIAFPHGNSTTAVKVAEAEAAARAGGSEIDAVVNNGKVLGGDWVYVRDEIGAINDVVRAHGAILKVIFENDYLEDSHIIRLCEICSEVGVAFVKTSTGYGFVKQPDGSYNYKGAIDRHLKLMRERCAPGIQVKAAGGVRTLD